ncbi:MAG: alanine--tRNA ligase [bacterium]|nr:alanine--tRNA ligase [bacterium]
MEWMSLNTLREKYLSFFESKGHLRLDSFPLVPKNDNSLLLINSGMAPMKKYFTGEITPPSKRVTTCQKCIRTPDIERVGKTARHGTYFEMLGNFSFGDYFKNEATAWAWEFCTVELGMDPDRLWISIYEDDDEAFKIWTEKVGIDPKRIVRMGKEDNFWEHGSGPCGPCSEIYYDRGEKYGCENPDCGVGCECDRYVEFWNLVFTQFDNDGNNNYTNLDHPNIDTGMGLERLACISQNVDNLFEVDTIKNIMDHLSNICGIKYKTDQVKDVSMRVITDHIRSVCFMLGDGVFPSNEGRGYVLRRLLRRAARHGRLLGVERLFLSDLCDTVINENMGAYPEILEKKDLIKKIINVEEENFNKTIGQGLKMLEEITSNSKNTTVSGEDLFRLYDTYGFPLDLTKDILEEKGFEADEEKFYQLMELQRERARSSRKNEDTDAWKGQENLINDMSATDFCGYNSDECQAKVMAIVKDSQRVSSAYEGEEAVIIFDNTPFYATSGGQIGDSGCVTGAGCAVKIDTTEKNQNGVFTHIGTVESGVISVGDVVTLQIDVDKRAAIRRNHTAAHLLQAGLRAVLGTHVEQAGQLVNEKEVRFDFTHFSALSQDEIDRVERFVNEAILSGISVENSEMDINEAKSKGAMALFGEKYGKVVRVVDIAGRSIELCGGTHVDNTAKIGLFKIFSEGSVASGIRRIQAYTGFEVVGLIKEINTRVNQAAAALKLNNSSELVNKCIQLSADLKDRERIIEKLNSELAQIQINGLFSSAKDVEGVKILTAAISGTGSDALRGLCDKIKDKFTDCVAVVAGVNGETATIAVSVGGNALEKGIHAGRVVSAVAAIAGGKGGGRPDFAMAGAKNVSMIDEALAAVEGIVSSMIK